ncbi:MAG: SRPBCC family protein [Halapricum sp.]
MFEIEPTISIDASPEIVWEYLIEIEEWWVPSNPEHESLEILSDERALQEGTRIRVKERIAGLPGVAEGEITEYVPRERITWEAPNTSYRYYGLTIHVDEGVSWRLAPTDAGTNLTAAVWATFPETLLGTVVEWIFKNVLDGVEQDYRHAVMELKYIKEGVEARNTTVRREGVGS